LGRKAALVASQQYAFPDGVCGATPPSVGIAMARQKKDITEPAKFDYRIEVRKSADGLWQAEKVFPEPRKAISDFDSREEAIIAMEGVANDKVKESDDVVDIVIYDETDKPRFRFRYKREVVKHVRLLQG